jgi:hypothetical protein
MFARAKHAQFQSTKLIMSQKVLLDLPLCWRVSLLFPGVEIIKLFLHSSLSCGKNKLECLSLVCFLVFSMFANWEGAYLSGAP